MFKWSQNIHALNSEAPIWVRYCWPPMGEKKRVLSGKHFSITVTAVFLAAVRFPSIWLDYDSWQRRWCNPYTNIPSSRCETSANHTQWEKTEHLESIPSLRKWFEVNYILATHFRLVQGCMLFGFQYHQYVLQYPALLKGKKKKKQLATSS
jgi:hypothetical protein